jgi:outer membrane protein assembly factor BamD (BamD/ComL family)
VGISKSTISEFITLLDDCEMGLYTQGQPELLTENYNKAIKVLGEIELNIKKI